MYKKMATEEEKARLNKQVWNGIVEKHIKGYFSLPPKIGIKIKKFLKKHKINPKARVLKITREIR